MMSKEEEIEYLNLGSRIKELGDLVWEEEKKREQLLSDVIRRSIVSGFWTLEESFLSCRLQPADEETEREIHKLLRETFKLNYHDSVRIPFEGFCLYVRVDDGEVGVEIEIPEGSNFTTFKKNGVQIEETSLAEYFCSELQTEIKRKEREISDLQEGLLRDQSKITFLKKHIKDYQNA